MTLPLIPLDTDTHPLPPDVLWRVWEGQKGRLDVTLDAKYERWEFGVAGWERNNFWFHFVVGTVVDGAQVVANLGEPTSADARRNHEILHDFLRFFDEELKSLVRTNMHAFFYQHGMVDEDPPDEPDWMFPNSMDGIVQLRFEQWADGALRTLVRLSSANALKRATEQFLINVARDDLDPQLSAQQLSAAVERDRDKYEARMRRPWMIEWAELERRVRISVAATEPVWQYQTSTVVSLWTPTELMLTLGRGDVDRPGPEERRRMREERRADDGRMHLRQIEAARERALEVRKRRLEDERARASERRRERGA